MSTLYNMPPKIYLVAFKLHSDNIEDIYLHRAVTTTWKLALYYTIVARAEDMNKLDPSLMDKVSLEETLLAAAKLVESLPMELEAAKLLAKSQFWEFNIKELEL